MAYRHPPNCRCLTCFNNRQGIGFAPKFNNVPPAPGVGRRLHKIGSVELRLFIYRKQRHYEVLINDILVGQSRDDDGHMALFKARAKLPTKKAKPAASPYYHAGEIFAYRGWRLVGDILCSVGYDQKNYDIWNGPVAKCEGTLEIDGANGLYAVKFSHAKQMMDGYFPDIHGIVGLSGIVVEHERGFRAERAVVRVLRVVPPVGDLVLKALEDRYQCQVFRQKSGGDYR